MTTTTTTTVSASPRTADRPRHVTPERGLPGWLHRHGFQAAVLIPSLTLVGIFVYGFIAYSVRVSLSRWQGLSPDLALKQPVGSTYTAMFQTSRFQADLRNILVFTVLVFVPTWLTALSVTRF